MNIINNFLKKNMESKISINVIGDSMLDWYYDVDVNRISPEFPIPVFKSSSEDPEAGSVPGGAANVAMQFNYFNVDVKYVSLITSLARIIYNARGINTDYCKVVDNMLLPVKKRIYSDGIPLSTVGHRKRKLWFR